MNETNRFTTSPVINLNVNKDLKNTNGSLLSSTNNSITTDNEHTCQSSNTVTNTFVNSGNNNSNSKNNSKDCSNTESSFYEDQLDSELECISSSLNMGTKNAANNNANVNFNGIYMPNSDYAMKNQALLNNPAASSCSKAYRARSGNHVSFNINNAIYTSRQETPIPISVLKQQTSNAINSCTISNGVSVNVPGTCNNQYPSSNGHAKPILVLGNINGGVNSNYDSDANEQIMMNIGNNRASSPLGSSLKKSNGISDLLNHYVQVNTERDLEKMKQHQQQHLHHHNCMNKGIPGVNTATNKTDTKTTIL